MASVDSVLNGKSASSAAQETHTFGAHCTPAKAITRPWLTTSRRISASLAPRARRIAASRHRICDHRVNPDYGDQQSYPGECFEQDQHEAPLADIGFDKILRRFNRPGPDLVETGRGNSARDANKPLPDRGRGAVSAGLREPQ